MAITGLAEDSVDIGRTGEGKVQKVMEATGSGYQEDFIIASREIKRFGRLNPAKKRPVLVVVEHERQRHVTPGKKSQIDARPPVLDLHKKGRTPRCEEGHGTSEVTGKRRESKT